MIAKVWGAPGHKEATRSASPSNIPLWLGWDRESGFMYWVDGDRQIYKRSFYTPDFIERMEFPWELQWTEDLWIDHGL